MVVLQLPLPKPDPTADEERFKSLRKAIMQCPDFSSATHRYWPHMRALERACVHDCSVDCRLEQRRDGNNMMTAPGLTQVGDEGSKEESRDGRTCQNRNPNREVSLLTPSSQAGERTTTAIETGSGMSVSTGHHPPSCPMPLPSSCGAGPFGSGPGTTHAPKSRTWTPQHG